jgi:hypothetical protein
VLGALVEENEVVSCESVVLGFLRGGVESSCVVVVGSLYRKVRLGLISGGCIEGYAY